MKSVDSDLLGRSKSESTPDSTLQVGIFALTGEYWTIGYGGVNCSLRNSLGLSYLQRLLQNPGEEFHAQDLLMGGTSSVQVADRPEQDALRSGNLTQGRPNDLGPMIDAQAKQEYKRKLLQLGEELADLRERGDYERADNVESEIESIQRELARALGLGGRDRRAGSAAERARINVTRAIRSAIQRVSEYHSALGKMLNESIRTGSFCRYAPNPKTAVSWRFTSDYAEGLVEVSPPAIPAAPFPAGEPGLPPAARVQTTFVGRAAERALLGDCLQRAMNGESGMVLISGPSGIGKTRLSRETGADAGRLGFVTLAGNCYDREDSVPFIAIVEAFEAALALAPALKDFREVLGDEAAEIARLMPQLRRFFPDIPPSLQATPEQGRRALFHAIAEVIVRRSRADPMLLLFEDVHWADEGTLAFLSHFARTMSRLRVVVVLTYRDDEIDPMSPFGETLADLLRCRVEQIHLRGLSETGVAEMIEALSGRVPPSSLVGLFYANTEGNPLFVEELFRHLERNGSKDAEGLEPVELDLPNSLRLVIGRRLARVGEETRTILGTAAVIGRSFTFALLEAATRVEAEQLIDLVEEAEKAGLITSRLRYPDAQFKFAHELIRRAVLEDLSVARRQRLHRNVAAAIELLHPNTAEDHAEDLAHHLWNAGATAETGKAVRYLQIAGTKAVQTAANGLAVSYFKKALEIVNSAPDSAERVQTELMLQVSLSVPLLTTKGFASPEVGAVYARARHLCRQAGEAPQLFPVLFFVWLFHTARAEHITARDLGEQCMTLAEKSGDPAMLLAAHHTLGASLSVLGDYRLSLEHLEQTIKLYDRHQHAVLAFQFGQDFGVVARSHAALDLWFLGYPKRALSMADDALNLARSLSHRFSLASALLLAAQVHQFSGDARTALDRSEEALKLSGEGDFSFWGPIANIWRGGALAQGAEISEIENGIARIREGLQAYRDSGARVGRPTFLALLAEAYRRVGQPSAGLETLSEAYATVKQSGERWFEPELYRLEGELTLNLSQAGRAGRFQQKRAEDCFRRALETAREQKAKLLELRAAISLHRLCATQGSCGESRRRLEELYGWFTEGLDTRDLIEAAHFIENRALSKVPVDARSG